MRIRPLIALLAALCLAPVQVRAMQAQGTPAQGMPSQSTPAQSAPSGQHEPVRDNVVQDKPAQDQDSPQQTDAGVAEQEQSDAVATSDDPDAAESAASKVPLAQIKRFVGVYNAVREAYVDPVDDEALMHAAIKGLLLDLDPHSTYFEQSDAQAFDEATSGAYDGIGVEIQQQANGTMKVVAPIDDTPAARAGLESGDIIVKVDGKPLRAGEDDASLRGAAGTKVTLTVVRKDVAKPFDISMQRERITITSVRGRMLEPGYAYLRIAAFQADTAADFEKVLARLQGGSGNGAPGHRLKGMVLDLRSNPGGLLVSAVQIADDLLDSGRIVSTRGRIAVSDTQFSATPGDLLHGAPLVVLVDVGSASAAEVLAGALTDNHRARIVGSRTFGKGSVQTLLPLDNGDKVKLTTARYYTPSGKSIQARGITPDVILHAPGTAPNGGHADYTEALLPGHLQGTEEGGAGSDDGEVLDGDAPIDAALVELKKMVAGHAGAKPVK